MLQFTTASKGIVVRELLRKKKRKSIIYQKKLEVRLQVKNSKNEIKQPLQVVTNEKQVVKEVEIKAKIVEVRQTDHREVYSPTYQHKKRFTDRKLLAEENFETEKFDTDEPLDL